MFGEEKIPHAGSLPLEEQTAWSRKLHKGGNTECIYGGDECSAYITFETYSPTVVLVNCAKKSFFIALATFIGVRCGSRVGQVVCTLSYSHEWLCNLCSDCVEAPVSEQRTPVGNSKRQRTAEGRELTILDHQ